MGSHSVTCNPAQVTFPPLPQTCKRLLFTQPNVFYRGNNPKMALSTGSGLIHLIHGSSGPRVLNPNGTSIGSSVFVGLAVASRCDPTTANNPCPSLQKNYLKIATVQMSVSSLVECTQNTCTRAFKGSLSGTTRVSRKVNRKVTRKVTPIWILLKQETVSGNGISWAKSAPCSRQITTPAPHHSVFTGQMPFLPPNQQRQSTGGKAVKYSLQISLF